MVKRCNKSLRREAVASPLDAARRARRRATADRRRPTTGLGVAHTARVEGPRRATYSVDHRRDAGEPRDRPARRLCAAADRSDQRSDERCAGAGRRGDGQVHRTSAATIASRENLTARRTRPEMAPQPLEQIESAPGNGMVSEASKPQDMVPGRAADRALRLTKGWDGSGGARETFPACKPLKRLKMELESADRSVRAASLEADVRSALPAARPRPPGDARRRRPWLAAAGATNRQAIEPRPLSRAAAPLAPTHAAPGTGAVAGRGPGKGTRGQKKAPEVLKSFDAKLKSAPGAFGSCRVPRGGRAIGFARAATQAAGRCGSLAPSR